VDENSTRPGHWLGLVLCDPFSALTLVVGGQEGHTDHKKPVPLIQRGCLPEWVEENLRGNWLTQAHLVKWPLNGSSCS